MLCLKLLSDHAHITGLVAAISVVAVASLIRKIMFIIENRNEANMIVGILSCVQSFSFSIYDPFSFYNMQKWVIY